MQRLPPHSNVQPRTLADHLGIHEPHHVAQDLRQRGWLLALTRAQPQRGAGVSPPQLGHRLEDLVLALEVSVDRAGAEPGPLADVADGRPVEPFLTEALTGGFENLGPPGFDVGLCDLGHWFLLRGKYTFVFKIGQSFCLNQPPFPRPPQLPLSPCPPTHLRTAARPGPPNG